MSGLACLLVSSSLCCYHLALTRVMHVSFYDVILGSQTGYPSLGCLIRSRTALLLVPVDSIPVIVVVPSLGSSLAFLWTQKTRLDPGSPMYKQRTQVWPRQTQTC